MAVNWDWNVLTAVSTTVLAATAIIATCFAGREIRDANRRAREANAHALWSDYLKIAFEHPAFADPTKGLAQFDYENQTINGSKELFQRYEWFTDFALDSSEEVWAINRDKERWDRSVRDQIRLHRDYLKSEHYRGEGYLLQHSRDFQKVMLDVLFGSLSLSEGDESSS
jgi:hypothetical protein